MLDPIIILVGAQRKVDYMYAFDKIDHAMQYLMEQEEIECTQHGSIIFMEGFDICENLTSRWPTISR